MNFELWGEELEIYDSEAVKKTDENTLVNLFNNGEGITLTLGENYKLSFVKGVDAGVDHYFYVITKKEVKDDKESNVSEIEPDYNKPIQKEYFIEYMYRDNIISLLRDDPNWIIAKEIKAQLENLEDNIVYKVETVKNIYTDTKFNFTKIILITEVNKNE